MSQALEIQTGEVERFNYSSSKRFYKRVRRVISRTCPTHPLQLLLKVGMWLFVKPTTRIRKVF